MVAIVSLIIFLLDIYSFILLGRALISWFPNMDYSNPIVRFLYEVTEPVLKPIRDAMPQTQGFDLSILVAFVGIFLFQSLLRGFFF